MLEQLRVVPARALYGAFEALQRVGNFIPGHAATSSRDGQAFFKGRHVLAAPLLLWADHLSNSDGQNPFFS